MTMEQKSKDVAVGFCLDESSSMHSCWAETISGFNEYIDKLRKQDGRTTITLTQFSSESRHGGAFRLRFAAQKVGKRTKLDSTTYVPDGNTPLLDAIGHTIKLLDKEVEKQPDVNPMVVIQTDGHENASREYSRDRIVGMIKKRERRGWVFVYLGANMDDVSAASGAAYVGMAAASSMGYQGKETPAAFAAAAVSTDGYRTARLAGTQYDSSSAGSTMKTTYQVNTGSAVTPPEPGLIWDGTVWKNADGTPWVAKTTP